MSIAKETIRKRGVTSPGLVGSVPVLFGAGVLFLRVLFHAVWPVAESVGHRTHSYLPVSPDRPDPAVRQQVCLREEETPVVHPGPVADPEDPIPVVDFVEGRLAVGAGCPQEGGVGWVVG